METRQSPPLSEMASQDDVSHAMKRSDLVKVRVLFVFAKKIFTIFSNALMLTYLVHQEVKSSREEQHKTAGIQRLDGDFAKLKSEFGQTHDSVSLYSLMEFFREMSLRDDD